MFVCHVLVCSTAYANRGAVRHSASALTRCVWCAREITRKGCYLRALLALIVCGGVAPDNCSVFKVKWLYGLSCGVCKPGEMYWVALLVETVACPYHVAGRAARNTLIIP